MEPKSKIISPTNTTLFSGSGILLSESAEVLIGVIAKVYLAELIEEARAGMHDEEENIKP